MEHQILPRGVSISPNECVPYVGNRDYLNVSFHEYKSRAGMVNGKPPTIEALQCWLFFGWLHEVLGVFVKEVTGRGLYEHDDFVKVAAVPPSVESSRHGSSECHPDASERSTGPFITTARLIDRLEQWRDLIKPEVARLKPQFDELYTSICFFRGLLGARPS